MPPRKKRVQAGAVVYEKPTDQQVTEDIFGDAPEVSPPSEIGAYTKPKQRCRSFHPADGDARCKLDEGHGGDHTADTTKGAGDSWPNVPEPIPANSELDRRFGAQDLSPLPEQEPTARFLMITPTHPDPGEQPQPLLGNGPIGASPKPNRKPTPEKTPAQIEADERRIKQVMEYLTLTGKVIRFAGYLFYASMHENVNGSWIEARIWTEHDLVRWYNAAAKYMGKHGVTMHASLSATMPESRKYENVEAEPAPTPPKEASLWEVT